MLQSFLTFDKLIGLKLIKFLYYIGLIGIIIGGIIAFFGALFSIGSGFIGAVKGMGMALFGTFIALLFWRFTCELYMLFFRMSDDLRDIKNNQSSSK